MAITRKFIDWHVEPIEAVGNFLLGQGTLAGDRRDVNSRGMTLIRAVTLIRPVTWIRPVN